MQDNLLQTLTASRATLDRQIEELLRDLARARGARGKITEGLAILGATASEFPPEEPSETATAKRSSPVWRNWEQIHPAVDEFGFARKKFTMDELLTELKRRSLWDERGSKCGFCWSLRQYLKASGYVQIGLTRWAQWLAPNAAEELTQPPQVGLGQPAQQ